MYDVYEGSSSYNPEDTSYVPADTSDVPADSEHVEECELEGKMTLEKSEKIARTISTLFMVATIEESCQAHFWCSSMLQAAERSVEM